MTTSNPAKHTPNVSDFMTEYPATVNAALSLADVQDRMYANNIRHLPVMSGDEVIGVISARDVAVAASIGNGKLDQITAKAAMTAGAYTCHADKPLDEVVHEMEAHRYGCAIVIKDKKPVGMFTTTDALRAVRSLIAGRPVEPAVHPTHIVEQSTQQQRTTHLTRASEARTVVSPNPFRLG